VHKGDTFYIPAGRIHTIGAGIMIAEIQQASTTTFRLYDYHRKDANGKERELHTEMAKRAIHFDDLEDPKVKYTPREDLPVNLIRSPFFTANLLKISDVVMRDYSELDTFVAIMALEGSAVLNCTSLLTRDAGNPLISTLRIQAGETALISARALGLEITPEGNFTALEALGI
jgi:mannose-6-phosphate isomerase